MLKGFFVVILALAIAGICLFILPELLEPQSYDLYIINGTIFALVSLLAINWIKLKYEGLTIPPSIFVAIFFLIIPPIGCLGYSILVKAGWTSMRNRPDFNYPVYLWYLGTMVFSLSLAAAHRFLPKTPRKAYYVWNTTVLRGAMSFFIFVSAIFTILAIYKIGYIPILKGNFDVERFAYDVTVGEYTIKFSRLWLVVFIIAIHLYFSAHKKRYLALMVLSAFLLVIYGNRTYMFIPVVYFLLFYLKHRKFVNVKVLASIILVAVALFYYIHQVREGSVVELQKVSPAERVVPLVFGEWREFSYVINDFKSDKNTFLGGKIFLGVVSTIFPKQIWQLFGLEKDKLFAHNAAEYFGKYFGHYAGVRIGVIGECFVGFGVTGIVLIMSFLGFIFSFLENLYMTLDEKSPLLMLITFALSIFMLLPLLTFINITSTIVFFGSFVMLTIFFGRRRCEAAYDAG